MGKGTYIVICVLVSVVVGVLLMNNTPQEVKEVAVGVQEEIKTKETEKPVEKVSTPANQVKQETNAEDELVAKYKDLKVIDVHNHDANKVSQVMKTWEKFSIDKTVLFGDISEPSAIKTDEQAFAAYERFPTSIYPFIAGVNIFEDEGVTYVRESLENGYLGIGEVAAASTYSPIVSKLKWKAKHPMDGKFPEIYKLAAEYNAPLLLHIDPLSGEPIEKLEEALRTFPTTKIIIAHGNVFNTPGNLERLLETHNNLYIDFFAGFTAYNKDSPNRSEDFVSVIEKYPDKFFISTDSGYGVTYAKAALAIYELLDLLKEETIPKVAHENFEKLIVEQKPTKTQIEKIKELSQELGIEEENPSTKQEANEIIFKLEKKNQ